MRTLSPLVQEWTGSGRVVGYSETMFAGTWANCRLSVEVTLREPLSWRCAWEQAIVEIYLSLKNHLRCFVLQDSK